MTRVLFVCVHNAGRSQMAEAFLNRVASARGLPVCAESAGTVGAGAIHPVVAEAMREVGVPLDGHRPKRLTPAMAGAADVVVTMGCGVDAESCPAGFLVSEDWGLADPAGQEIEAVRRTRDEIRARVDELVGRLAAGGRSQTWT